MKGWRQLVAGTSNRSPASRGVRDERPLGSSAGHRQALSFVV